MICKSARLLAALLTLSVVAPARAQEPKTTTRDVLLGSVKVERKDISTRSLTLKTPEGLTYAVYVGPDLKAFDDVKVGDTVTVRIQEAIVVAAARPNAKTTPVTDTTAAAQKAAGERGDVMQQLKATVKIESIDRQQQIVVYRAGDGRSVTRAIADPRLLEGLKVGDTIEITYTRARAIEITKGR